MPRTLAFFSGTTPATGQELWETDGTAGGTALVADIVPGVSGSFPGSSGFAAAGAGAVVFAAGDGGPNGLELFVSNGAAAGTVELSNAFVKVPYSYIRVPNAYVNPLGSFTPLSDGRVLFLGATNTGTLQLWTTDSTVAGTRLVRDLAGASPGQPVPTLTAIGRGRAVIAVSPAAIAGQQTIYGTDGTDAGTAQLSSNASVLASLGDGRALLNQPGRTGTTLEVTDGTVAGTVALRGFLAGSLAATAIGNGRALLSASDGLAGQELWLTDGTAAGTVKLLQGPAIGPDSPQGLNPVNVTALGNGRTVFTGNDGSVRNAVFVTDGTAAGTTELAEIGPPGSTTYSVLDATALGNGRVAFRVADNATDNTALYVTDGTVAGTSVAHGFAATTLGNSPFPALAANITALPGGTAVFSVNDGSTNFQVWRTDGTAAGTYQVAAVAQAGYNTPQFKALPDGRALFTVSNGDDTFTLWSTNGTAAGTAAIPGVSVGSNLSGTFGLATVADLDPLFDTDYYNARNPDVPAAGINAYQHFLANGGREGRAPDPFFDSALYLRQNPDVAVSGMNPLTHFEMYGWKEGRDPSLLFSVSKYLAANPDVAAAGIDPLEHYLRNGQAESRPTYLSGGVRSVDPLVSARFYDAQLGATLIPPVSGAAAQQAAFLYDASGWQRGLNPDPFFDTSYYLAHNADVAAAHVNPLTQYEQYGWKEGRDPSASFSTAKYLAANPDVAAAGIDPLLHYVQYGQAEGRAIYPA